jgi:hypothetical protein
MYFSCQFPGFFEIRFLTIACVKIDVPSDWIYYFTPVATKEEFSKFSVFP